MKKIITTLLFVLFANSTFSQQTDPAPAFTKQDYLKKSKNQKTVAFILLGTGIATLAIAAQLDNELGFAGLMAYAGGFCAFISVVYFIDSNKNKHKAMKVSFKMQSLPQLQNIDLVNQTIPSLNLKISL